jgi:hypothetical protein
MPHRKAQADAEKFRREAATCRQRASETSDPVTRHVYTDLAKQFDRKADDALTEASALVERKSGSRRQR